MQQAKRVSTKKNERATFIFTNSITSCTPPPHLQSPPLLLPRSHHHAPPPAIPRFALGRITTEFLFKTFNQRWVRGPGPNVHFFARSSCNHRQAFWFSRGCACSAAAAFSMLSAFNTHWRIPFVQRASKPWQHAQFVKRCSRLQTRISIRRIITSPSGTRAILHSFTVAARR